MLEYPFSNYINNACGKTVSGALTNPTILLNRKGKAALSQPHSLLSDHINSYWLEKKQYQQTDIVRPFKTTKTCIWVSIFMYLWNFIHSWINFISRNSIMVVASMKIVSVGVHNNVDIHVCTLQYSQRILFTTTKIVSSNFVFYWHLHFIAVL